MKKTALFCLISFLSIFPFTGHAQQVVASAGGYFEGDNISLSWTLGEPVIETFSNSNITLTQGFQQTYNFYLSQILNIPAGWSGVSGFVDPVNKGVENLFDEFVPDFIILASMSEFYFPNGGVNTIVNWNYQNGYQIKTSNEFELTLTGSKISDPTVYLVEGWNLIPVLSACEASTSGIFSDMNGLIIAKEVAGTEIYWPEFGIETLNSLLPGRAYLVLTGDASSFTYPDCSKSSVQPQPSGKPEIHTVWNKISYTPTSHTIAFPSEVITSSELQPGDIIGAFTPEGLCSGQLEISTLNANLALSAFADDEMTMVKDGFKNGEMFRFKVFRPEANEEINVEVQFDKSLPNLGVFADQGLSAVKSVDLVAPSVNETSDLQCVLYPNPSNGNFTLTLGHWSPELQIQITDARGRTVELIHPSDLSDGSSLKMDFEYLPRGVYLMKLMTRDTVQIKKFVIN
ncbi:MAG: T9SS type A sorting domain-containing protein [Bacteroidales bacterium]|nr:T9SS type A sorting domain-containing protein [Bacteroidales bacterium]